MPRSISRSDWTWQQSGISYVYCGGWRCFSASISYPKRTIGCDMISTWSHPNIEGVCESAIWTETGTKNTSVAISVSRTSSSKWRSRDDRVCLEGRERHTLWPKKEGVVGEWKRGRRWCGMGERESGEGDIGGRGVWDDLFEAGYLLAYPESSQHLPLESKTAEWNVCSRALPLLSNSSYSPDIFGWQPSALNRCLCPQNSLKVSMKVIPLRRRALGGRCSVQVAFWSCWFFFHL